MRLTLDRAALMRRAHKIARDFAPIMGGYRSAISYALTIIWADVKARSEIKQAYAHIARRPLTAAQIADSQRATRRCGASFT
jgi:hypothetical protein